LQNGVEHSIMLECCLPLLCTLLYCQAAAAAHRGFYGKRVDDCSDI
jgi:hypothetical protein